MVRLRTFGGLSIQPGSDAVNSTLGKRPLALLALLAIAGDRGLRREKAVALLWPESDEERGRNSLSQALTALRRALGAEAIEAGSTELRLCSSAITSDVQEFEEAVESNDLERAVALNDGQFLDGVYLKAAAEFDEWVEGHRARLTRMKAAALEQLARDASGTRPAAAIDWWRKLSVLDPTSARATAGLMQALAATGERAAALHHYRVYETLIREDFGAVPDQYVVALATQLKHGADQRSGVAGPSRVDHDVDFAAVKNGSQVDPLPASAGNGSGPHAQPRRALGRFWPGGLAISALAIVGAASVVVAFSAREPVKDSSRLAVVPLRNLTGDDRFDALGALAAEYIADGVQRTGLMEVADPMTTGFIATELRDSAAGRADDAREAAVLGDATRAQLILSGSVSRDGDSLVITTRLTDGVRGTVVSVAEPVRASAGLPEGALQVVRQRALGLLAVHRSDAIADVGTIGSSSPPTLAAYTEYVQGLARFQRGDDEASVPYFERAYTADSTFVAPLIWLAWAGNSPPNGPRRVEGIVRELARHRPRLGPIDREALAYLEATVRADEAGRTVALQRASALSPGSIWSYNVGNHMNGLGRNDEAAAALALIDRRHGWIRLWPVFWRQYARALHYVDHERELAIVREARSVLASRAPDTRGGWWVGLLLDEGRALVSLGRREELLKVLADLETVADPAGGVGNALQLLALELANRGDSTLARETAERAVAWYRGGGRMHDASIGHRAGYGGALYAAGRWSEARAVFESLASTRPNDWTHEAWVGLSAARLGDSVRARRAMKVIEAFAVSGREVNPIVASRVVYLARIAAVLGDRDLAVAYIRRLNAHTGGRMPRHSPHMDFASLAAYPPFNRVTRPTP